MSKRQDKSREKVASSGPVVEAEGGGGEPAAAPGGVAAELLTRREQALLASEQLITKREESLAQATRLLTDRETALNRAMEILSEREARFAEVQRSLAEQEESLKKQQQALHQREDEVAIREVAAEEAMALAEEAMNAAEESSGTMGKAAEPARPAEPAKQEGRKEDADSWFEPVLAGPPERDDALLEGPAEPPPVFETPAAPASTPAREIGRGLDAAAREMEVLALATQMAEERRKNEETRRKADETRKLEEEANQLIALVRSIPQLSQIEARVQKALQAKNLTSTVMMAFYNLSLNMLKEDMLAKMKLLSRQDAESAQRLSEANAAVSSLKEDFDRYRTRVKSEQELHAARASEEVLRKLVPVADNFSRALSSTSQNVEAVRDGVRMIYRQFEDVLSQSGLVPIKAVGEKFDPRVHEALMQVETSEVPEDTVCEEIQRGYYLAGKVFRPALVKVSCAPSSPPTTAVSTPGGDSSQGTAAPSQPTESLSS